VRRRQIAQNFAILRCLYMCAGDRCDRAMRTRNAAMPLCSTKRRDDVAIPVPLVRRWVLGIRSLTERETPLVVPLAVKDAGSLAAQLELLEQTQ